MYREIQNILSELKGLTWEILVEILSTRSCNLDIYPTSTLSTKQALFVYEWYEENKSRFATTEDRVILENKNSEKKEPYYIKYAIEAREHVLKRTFLSRNDIKYSNSNAHKRSSEQRRWTHSENSQQTQPVNTNNNQSNSCISGNSHEIEDPERKLINNVPQHIKEAVHASEIKRRKERLLKQDTDISPIKPYKKRKNKVSKGPSMKGLSSNPKIRAEQEKIIREKQMREIGPDAHIIYIPAGGQNKKY